MADLFISYSREDSARAGQIAQGMIAAGFDVFWDTDVPPGQTWADYIEDKLTNCAAVIVLWSQNSTKSNWVKEEARMGRERGKLIPASLDSSIPPFGFGEVQAANLSTWNGEMQGHADWDRLVGAVQNAVARAHGGEVSPPKPPTPRPAMMQPPPAPPPLRPAMHAASSPPPNAPAAPPSRPFPMPVVIGVAVAVLAGVGAFFFMNSRNEPQVAAAPPAITQPAGPQTASQAQQQIQSMAQFAPPQQQIQPPSGVSMQQYTQHVQARLAQVQQTMLSQGWQQVGAPHNSQLGNGETETVPAQLMQGVRYQIVGVCDQDCGDMDLRLRDAANNALAEDVATDNIPVLNVTPAMSGNYTLDVIMYACSNQPCFYSVALFGRMDGQ
ncbi:MAG: TIR domain-containing protein [Alphaproteobacteria bacterium]|nr:TIR domain-containing protein [Alphaproteobacteria bacterium]